MTPRLLLTALLLLSVATSLAVAVLALRARSRNGATALAALELAAAWWALARVPTLYTTDVGEHLFWVQVLYVGTVATPIAWVAFAFGYTNRSRFVTRRTIGLLSAVPLLSLVLLWTTPEHALFYRRIDAAVVLGSVPTLRTVRGPGYWLNIGYSFLLMAVGTAVLLERALRTGSVYRRQAAALVAIAVVPWAASVLYIAGIVPILPTPMMIAVSGVIALWAVSRYGLLDLVPVARDRVLDEMDDGVVVLDARHRVVDCNPAAAPALSGPHQTVLSDHAADALAEPRLVEAVTGPGSGTVEFSVAGDDRRHFDARVSTLGDGTDGTGGTDDADGTGRTPGHLILLRDVTESRRYRRELEAKNRRLDEFAGVVSHDLRNPLNVAQGYAEMLDADGGGGVDDERDATGARGAGGTGGAGGAAGVRPAEKVTDALDRMDGMIDDVLALARGPDALEREPGTDVGEVARRAWNSVDTAGATLRCGLDLTTRADGSQLQRAFENLFRNSVEHGSTGDPAGIDEGSEHGSTAERGPANDTPDSDRSPPTITVGGLPDSDDGFFVADDGPGIPAGDRETVFETGQTTESGNTGFGLAVVRRIVEAHGWGISVTDAEGGGARFEIRR